MPVSPAFQHVFVLMLENHSFDNLLGFSGISGTDAGSGLPRTIPAPQATNSSGGRDWPTTTPAVNPMRLDPGHEFHDTLVQQCGPGAVYPPGGPYPPVDHSGFAADFAAQRGFAGSGATPGDPLRCYDPKQVPVLTALASEFVLCDRWFSSMPGPTWPNRFFVHAASAGGLDHTPTDLEIVEFDVEGFPLPNGTIFDRLTRARLPFRIYRGDLVPMVLALRGWRDWWWRGELRSFSHFGSDLHAGYDAAYTFIEPSYGRFWHDFTCGTSQHPLDDIARGEWLIKCVYEAIRNSPVWDSSVLIVTWDEHGGFYDGAVPPAAPAPGDTTPTSKWNRSHFAFDVLGVRVPAVVVSPYTERNLIDSTVYDHTSVLATLERARDLHPLTNRDAAAQDIAHLMTLTSPRDDAPETLPDPAPQAGGCSPINACGAVPSTDVETLALAAAEPAPNEPLGPAHPAFLHGLLMRDVAAAAPEERAARRARGLAVSTLEELRQYAHEVAVRAAGAPPA